MKITCPRCGVDLKLTHPDSYLTCEFCQNSLYVDLDRTVAVYSYRPKIDPHQVGSHLKRDFQKMGFDEQLRIVRSAPVFFPFWLGEGLKILLRGSSGFPSDHIKMHSANRMFFDASQVDYRTEIGDIDTQPPGSKDRILIYCPFYKVAVEFQQKEYIFFVDAVSGEVYGDPIPYMSGKELNPLFVLFMIFFVVFLALNYFIDHFLLAVVLNGLLFLAFFQLSSQIIEKQMYGK